jgi:hypothetical protein
MIEPRRLNLTHLCLGVFSAAMMVLVSPAAHAFTVETKSTNNNDGTPKFTDPDEKVERFGNGNVSPQQGNSALRFDVRPGGPQRGWANPMLDNGLPRDNR